MRRAVIALLTASLLLSACTDDDPTMDPDASPTEQESPTEPEPTTGTAEPTAGGTDSTDSTEDSEASGEEAEGANNQDVDVRADLTGAAEVPGPGDEGGSGSFVGTIELGEAAGELCYELEVSGLSTAVTAAHIHRGTADEAGEVVIELEAPVEGSVTACTAVDATDLVPLLEETSTFYVNVHTESHPDGAVRGQLESEE